MAETPRGYWIVRADVHDADAYAAYIAANAEAFAAYGARFLVRGPAHLLNRGSGPRDPPYGRARSTPG